MFLLLFLALAVYVLVRYVWRPSRNPLLKLAGPPIKRWFGSHTHALLNPDISPRVHELLAKKYGRTLCIRGGSPWDQRLFTMDPIAITHILRNPEVYEKPWESRTLISSLIGQGMFSSEGPRHRIQRQVASPAFSSASLQGLVPIVFRKGIEIADRFRGFLAGAPDGGYKLDLAHWMSRATFDVVGLAGFGYDFGSIANEDDELFRAYRDMFEIAISQGSMFRTMLGIYFPRISRLFPGKIERTIDRCQEVIYRVAGKVVEEKKKRIIEGEKSGKPYEGKDMLTLFLKANLSKDLPPENRISDREMLHNVNTMTFAGSDTSSLALTWTLLYLAQRPETQDRLRRELMSVLPSKDIKLSELSNEEIDSLYAQVANLPFLNNVVRESMRLTPPIHSSLRVATKDDVIPTLTPVHYRDGTIDEKGGVLMPKGSIIHVAIEAFNHDREAWGEDAWEFNPDRWDNLPDKAYNQPGMFAHTMTFSLGPRSCIGYKFALIEIKSFLFILLTNLAFEVSEEKITKENVVVTRPYVKGRFKDGTQCPIIIKPIPHS